MYNVRFSVTAIILAAGIGRRMGPGAPPKCLLSVGGQTLLGRLLDLLRAVGVRKVVVVAGYAAEAVTAQARAHARGLSLTVLHNPRYRDGAILSLWTARDQFADDLVIMDADVLCPQAALERLVRSPQPNGLLVDRTSPDTGEEQIVLGRGARVLHITKRPPPELLRELTPLGESVGFLKLSRPAAAILRDLLETAVAEGRTALEHEQLYPGLFHAVPVGFEPMDGLAWTEIDTPEDLARAEREILPRWRPTPCLNRRIARWGLPWALRRPVTPNQWTAVSLGLGLAAAAVLADGRYALGVLGALCFEAFYVVDDWDGEVARAKGLSSRWGGWFDVLVDLVVHVALAFGLAAGGRRAGAGDWVTLAGLSAVAGLALSFLVTLAAKAFGFGPAVPGDLARGPRHRAATPWLAANLTHDNFSLVVLAAMLLDARLPLLGLLAVGPHAFWLSYLWAERRRLVYSVAQARRKSSKVSTSSHPL